MSEGEVIRRELVVARCDPPTLLDLVEEPLDQIARTIEPGAEADRLLAIASRRNVCPSAPLDGKCSDPVGVIATVGQQHRS